MRPPPTRRNGPLPGTVSSEQHYDQEQDNTTQLFVPDLDDDTDTLTAALAYAKCGLYVVPLRRGAKHPGSVVGQGWHRQSSRDPEKLVAWFAGTSHGIALHLGPSGAIAFDVDDPDQMPTVLGEAIERDHPPFQATRANVEGKGHYLYAAPFERRFGNSTGRLDKGWGEVRGYNGVIAVQPSEHAKAHEGGQYKWVRTGRCPPLPGDLAALLTGAGDTVDTARDADIRAFCQRHTEQKAPQMLTAVIDGFRRDVSEGGSRHDAAVTAACWAAREARVGTYGAGSAFQWLRGEFVAAMTGPRRGSDRVLPETDARSEFAGIVAWAVAQANAADLAEIRRAIECRVLNYEMPGAKWAANHDRENGTDQCKDGTRGSNGSGAGAQPAETPHAVMAEPPLTCLPQEFWDARPVFRRIRQAAWSRNRSGDVALHVVLARESASVSHRLRLDTGVGDIAVPVNYFAAIVGNSGAGKSSGKAVAARLLETPADLDMRDDQPIGTGEGLAESFYGFVPDPGNPKNKIRQVVRHNSFFYCDEGEVMKELQARKGATLGPQLRSAWSGAALGQANAGGDRYRYVPAGTYSLGLVVAFQYNTVQPLLADVDGGTPQRFAYVAATDPNIPDENLDWPGGLQLDPGVLHPSTETLFKLDPKIKQEIRTEDRARQRGEIRFDPLDSQEPFLRVKLAALLALLDNRIEVTVDDWDLAHMVLTTSQQVRTELVNWGTRQRTLDEQTKTDKVVARELYKAHAVSGATSRILTKARWVRSKVTAHHKATSEPITYGALKRMLSGRDRNEPGLFEAAVALAIAQEWVMEIEGGLQPPPVDVS